MTFKPWAMAPTDWIRDGRIKQFQWHRDKAAGTAALMAFYCFVQVARSAALEDVATAGGSPVACLTYDQIQALSGLSRASIADAITMLADRGMISPLPARSHYALPGLAPGSHWTKLPGKPMLSQGGSVQPFRAFTLRGRRELDALKLFFYYASIRDRDTSYSRASFEKIHEGTGIREAEIPAANSFLVASGLLARVQVETNPITHRNEANRYYLTGYNMLFLGQETTPQSG